MGSSNVVDSLEVELVREDRRREWPGPACLALAVSSFDWRAIRGHAATPRGCFSALRQALCDSPRDAQRAISIIRVRYMRRKTSGEWSRCLRTMPRGSSGKRWMQSQREGGFEVSETRYQQRPVRTTTLAEDGRNIVIG